MSGKISQYTEALSVANDDFFDVSIDTGGGVYATRKVKKSNLGIGGNTIYTADDTLTGNRVVNLLSYSLDFNGGATHFDDTSAVGKITIASIDRAVFSHKNHLDTTNYALLQTENGITVLNAVSGQKVNFNVGNVTHASLFDTGNLSIGNSSASARLHVKGSTSTSGTTTALFENDSGTELFKILDDGAVTYDIGNTQFLIDGETNGGTTTSFRVNTNGGILPYKSFFQIDDQGLVEIRGTDGSGTKGALRIYDANGGDVTFHIKSRGDGFWLQRSGNPITIGQYNASRVVHRNNYHSFETSGGVETHRLRTQGGSTTSFLMGTGFGSGTLTIGATAPVGTEKISLQGETYISDQLTVNGDLILESGYERTGIVTTSTSSSPVITGKSVWRIDISGSSLTPTLGDGVTGQRLTVYIYQETTQGDAVITPTTANGFTSITLLALGNSVDLIWDDTEGWTIIGGNGYTT